MVVVDASAVAHAVLRETPDARALRQRLVATTCHAPHLHDVELGNIFRRYVLRRELEPSQAPSRLLAALALVDVRHASGDRLALAAWGLHGAVSFYDATYVALAQALDLPLLTADARLARAPGLPCAVELVGP